MLKLPLTHPQILSALASAGHGAKVLIADGDYPVSTTSGPNAQIVHLNLSPGIVKTTEVLSALLAALPIEGAQLMDVPDGDPKPVIWTEYANMFYHAGCEFETEILERFDFYEEVKKDTTTLIIQTGETRDYSNLLLRIGSLW